MRCLLLMCLALLPSLAFADGKVFPPIAIRENVTIPDQQALIHWADGTERLVIQTSFSGTGTNFAWVVPLPSKPVIEKAPAGLFPTLNYLLAPKLVDRVPPWCGSVVFGLGLLGLILDLRSAKQLTVKGSLLLIAVCLASFVGGVPVGIFASALLILGVVLVCAGREPVYILLLLTLTGLLLGALLMPALGSARGTATSPKDRTLEILERTRVGAYDTVTLSAKDPAELVGWLENNGFAFSSNSLPIIADYTKREWVFVAAKLERTNSARQTESIHPLSFTFKSPEAIYPMRLTGVDGGPLSVDLYLFGPGTASATHFALQHSSRPAFPDPPANFALVKPEPLQIHYPVLREWVKDALVATSLHADLSKEQQGKDVTINWAPFRHKISRQFSPKAARTYSANMASAVLLGGVAILSLLRLRKRRVSGTMSFGLAMAVAATGLAMYASLEKVPVRYGPRSFLRHNLRMLGALVHVEDTIDRVRSVIESELTRDASGGHTSNAWLGGRIHEEESPGNYVLRETGSAIQFVAYDAAGAEHVLESSPKPQATNGVAGDTSLLR